MTNIQSIRNDYQHLYIDIAQYIWPFEFLELLATLEAIIYTAFPDVEQLKAVFDKVSKYVRSELDPNDDENKSIFKSLNAMQEELDSCETIYHMIGNVNEVKL